MDDSNRDPVNACRRALLSTAMAMAATSAARSADLGDAPSSVSAYPTISALRAASGLIAKSTAIRWVSGSVAPGDGGGGTFVFDRLDASSEDNNATIIVDRAGNRWRRQVDDSRVNVKWFGAVGDGTADDTHAIQSAVNYISEHDTAALFLPHGTYRITECIRVGGRYFRCLADHAKIINGNVKYGLIAGPTSAEMATPTSVNPGPMQGCAFYFTSLIYYSIIERLTISGFRFGMAWLTPHNSPVIRECTFENCNVAIFCYQGSQNYQLINCNAENCNVFWVSSATCYPRGTDYADQDNYFTDGLRIANEGGYGSVGPLTVNAFFDVWFVRSILRPDVKSLSASGETTYNDFRDKPYPVSHDHCQASGRLVFMPFRNTRSCYGLALENIDMRGGARRGIGLVNTSVFDFVFENPAIEGMWSRETRAEDGPALQMGAALSGDIAGVSPFLWSVDTSASHPLIRWTERGGYVGAGSRLLAHLGTDLAPAPGQQYFGFIRGEVHRQGENVFVSENNPDGRDISDTRDGAAVSQYFDFRIGTKYTDHKSELIEDGVPFIGTLPIYDGKYWRPDINFILTNAIAGLLEVSVLNLSEGAWDHGEFYVEAGPRERETFTLQAPVENGSPFVTIDAKPLSTARFTRFQFDTGSHIVLDYYDEGKNGIHPIGGVVTGLTSVIPTGAKLTRANVCDALTQFSRGWVDVGFGISGYAGPATLAIKNNVVAYNSLRGASLYLVVKYKSNPRTSEKRLASGPPTRGMWARNAIVWHDRCEAGGVIGWVCVEGGSPGQWKSFGQIAT